MNDEELKAKVSELVKQELAEALAELKRELLAELRPAATSAPADSSAPAKSADAEAQAARNASVNPPSGDAVSDEDPAGQRVSTRGGMHVYGPRVAAEHANFAPPTPATFSMPDIRPGEHANFAPQVDLPQTLAPAPLQNIEGGGLVGMQDGHANFAGAAARWVGLGKDRRAPVVRLVLPDGTQVTLPAGVAGPFEVGAYVLAGAADPQGGEQ